MKKTPSIREAMMKTHKAIKFLFVAVFLSFCFSVLDKIFPDTEWLEITDLIFDMIEWIAVIIYLIRFIAQVELSCAMTAAIQEVIQEDNE